MMSEPVYNIALITHAFSHTGLGHLSRCLILHNRLIKLNCNSQLWINDNQLTRRFLKEQNKIVYYEDVPANIDLLFDLCIVDLYNYQEQFYKKILQITKKIAIFDDTFNEIPQSVAAVINVNAYGSAQRYSNNLKVFAGAQYSLINTDFYRFSWQNNLSTLFICTGGSDPERQTKRWVQAALTIDNAYISVVLGSGYEWEEDALWLEQQARVTCIKSPVSLAKIASQAHMAVISAGTLLTELLTMGVPTISLALASNQSLGGTFYLQQKATVFLGDYTSVSDDKLKAEIAALFTSEHKKQRLSQQAQKLMSRSGAEHLASDLKKWIHNDDV